MRKSVPPKLKTVLIWCSKVFFRAISQAEHPLILFIDDLQWADLASLNLLKTLMSDTEKSHFFIIGAFRDNEVDNTHPLMLMLDELNKAQIQVTRRFLPNLTNQDVNQLISDTLGCETAEVRTLSNLVSKKTAGNAFFTTEFLKSLYQQELLTFNLTKQQWQWEMAKIDNLSITDNVVELVASKIGLLPPDSIEVLKLASCIANQFDLQTLSIIYQHSLSDTLAALWKAIETDLVLPLDEHYKQLDKLPTSELQSGFKFQHDRIQQAAYSLIPDSQKPSLHQQVGQLLLANTPKEQLEEKIFDIVNQLNFATELLKQPSQQQELAQLKSPRIGFRVCQLWLNSVRSGIGYRKWLSIWAASVTIIREVRCLRAESQNVCDHK